jgi:membrane-bound metal-dependent hydrolase YbcI (DUF457 family)
LVGCLTLPFTPFHYPIAYLLHKLDKRLPLPALIIGSMVPDLEIPFIILFVQFRDRLVLHSLIGGVLVGVPLILMLLGIYGWLIPQLFPVDAERLSPKCKVTTWAVLAATIGVLSHVLLDATHHQYNPLLWPITAESINTLVLVDISLVLPVVYIVMGGLALSIIFYVQSRYEKFFEETLSG